MARGRERPGGAPGKLKEAAEAWAYAHTGQVDPSSAALDLDSVKAMRDLGVPEDQIALALEAERDAESDGIEIWPDNWPIVMLFLDVGTQWRLVLGYGAGCYVGLDYAGVDALMRRRRIRDPDGEIFEGLQVMERAALPILNEAMS